MESVDLPLSEDAARLKAALINSRGNITKATIELKCTKPWLMQLLRRHNLNEYARRLRTAAGQPSTGRPLKIIPQAITKQ